MDQLLDMEAGYQSAEFAEYCHSLSYRIETSPTRDKHAHGIAERSVGNIVTKANIAMLGNINNPCPQQFWPDINNDNKRPYRVQTASI